MACVCVHSQAPTSVFNLSFLVNSNYSEDYNCVCLAHQYIPIPQEELTYSRHTITK